MFSKRRNVRLISEWASLRSFALASDLGLRADGDSPQTGTIKKEQPSGIVLRQITFLSSSLFHSQSGISAKRHGIP